MAASEGDIDPGNGGGPLERATKGDAARSSRPWLVGGAVAAIAAITALALVLLALPSGGLLGPSGWQGFDARTLRSDGEAARLTGFVRFEAGHVTGFQDRVYLLIGRTELDAEAADAAFIAAGFERAEPSPPTRPFTPGTIADVPGWRPISNAVHYVAAEGSEAGIASHEAWLDPLGGRVLAVIAEM